MADKVDYRKKTIDWANIVVNLHNVAMEQAQKVKGDVNIVNSAFSQDNKKLVGWGDTSILLVSKNEKPFQDSDDDRAEYLNVLKTYIKYFFSTEQDNLVKSEDLNPITDTVEVKESRTPKIFPSRMFRNVEKSVDYIFEADSGSSGSSGSPTPAPSADPESSEPSDSEKRSSPPTPPTEGPNVIGYQYFCFIDYVKGAKKQSRMASFKNSFKNLASGSVADLRNFKINFMGGGQLKVGRIFSPEEWRNILGANQIDVATVQGYIQNIIDKDHPNNDCHTEVLDNTDLEKYLNVASSLTPDVMVKLTGSRDRTLVNFVKDWFSRVKNQKSVIITVNRGDVAYDSFNRQYIADVCTKAFGQSLNFFFRHEITEDDVIYIEDLQSLYNYKSAYKRMISRRHNAQDDMAKPSPKPSTTKESLKSDIVQRLVNFIFEDNELLFEAVKKIEDVLAFVDRCGVSNIFRSRDDIESWLADNPQHFTSLQIGVYDFLENEFFTKPIMSEDDFKNKIESYIKSEGSKQELIDYLYNMFKYSGIPERRVNGDRNFFGTGDNELCDWYIVTSKYLTNVKKKSSDEIKSDGTVVTKPDRDSDYKPSEI